MTGARHKKPHGYFIYMKCPKQVEQRDTGIAAVAETGGKGVKENDH